MTQRWTRSKAMLLVTVALVAAGCIGDSDDAAFVGPTSAMLRGHGTCNNSQVDSTHGSCFYYFQVRVKNTTTWLSHGPSSDCPTYGSPVVADGISNTYTWPLACTWTDLAPDTDYEFQLCGGDKGGSAFCGSVRSFTTTTFTNPLTWSFFNATLDLVVSAPKINFFDDTYYLTGSGENTQVYASSDMLSWHQVVLPTFTNSKTDGSRRPLWASDSPDTRNSKPGAPVNIRWWGTELHKVHVKAGGTGGSDVYVIVSSFDHDVMGATQSSIGLATAPSVMGPYTWLPDPVDFPKNTEQHIDPTIFVDGNNYYLLHAVNGGAITRVKLDPYTLATLANSTPKVILDATTANTVRCYEYDGPRTGHPEDTCTSTPSTHRAEAPGIFKGADGTYFLYYATGSSDPYAPDSYAYTLGMARRADLNGLFTKMDDTRLVNNTDDWRAAGHGGIVADRAHRLWYVYHSYKGSEVDDPVNFPHPQRYVAAQQIFWNANTNWYYFEDAEIRSEPGVPSQ